MGKPFYDGWRVGWMDEWMDGGMLANEESRRFPLLAKGERWGVYLGRCHDVYEWYPSLSTYVRVPRVGEGKGKGNLQRRA